MNVELNLLLVDDDEFFTEIVLETVKGPQPAFIGVHVHRLRDGAELAPYLEQAANPANSQGARWPDLILMDERMPQMDGTAALQILRATEATKAIMVGLFSASDDPKMIAQALAQGANFCLTKPLEYETLVTVLGRACDFIRYVALPPHARPHAQAA